MRLYHRSPVATKIMHEGFGDGEGYYGTSSLHRGVWVSNHKLDANEGAFGDGLIALEIPVALIEKYEWKQEPALGYREWLVPANVLNQFARMMSIDEGQTWVA